MTEFAPFHYTEEQIKDEEKLIIAAKENSRHFEPLYKSYYERIARYIYHRVESKELAFEITAQVFYLALNNLSKYTPKGLPFSAWLFRIAGNELNQWFRKNKAQRVLNMDTEGLGELKDNMEENSSAEMDKHLFDALQELEAEEMELINMRFFEKRSFKEISDILQIGESACKMRLYRILEQLKTLLTQLQVH